MDELVPIQGRCAFAPGIDGTGQVMGQDGQGLALAVFFLQTREVFLPCWIVAQTQHSRFGERPLEVGMADLGASRAVAFPGGFLGAFHQATVRDKILPPWEAVDVMDFIEQHPTEDLANAGHRPEQVKGVGVVCCGRGQDRQLHVTEQSVVVANQRQVDREALLHRGSGEAFRHSSPIRFVGDLLAHLREVLLPLGILEMCEQLRALTHEMQAAPQQIPGRPQGGGIDIGLREHATTEQDRDLVGIDLVVFRFATVDGLHVEGMAQDKGNPFLRAEVGEPGPGEQAFDRDDDVSPIGCNVPEKRLRAGFHVAMQQDLAILVEDADIHGPGVHVDAAVKLMLLGGESHEVSSSCAC